MNQGYLSAMGKDTNFIKVQAALVLNGGLDLTAKGFTIYQVCEFYQMMELTKPLTAPIYSSISSNQA